MGSMDDVHAELDDVRDLLGEDCAFKVRMGRLLSAELSPLQYVRAAVRSYVDMQMDEAERGETVVVEADEWERVRDTAAEALQKWEKLKTEVRSRGSDQGADRGWVPLEPEGAVRLAEKDRSEAERQQKLAAARNGVKPVPTPPPPDKDRMVDQVRSALATVQHCDQRSAKARKRREEEGRPVAESWETPKPVSKPEPAPEPKSEVKPKPKPKATSVKTSAPAVAGQRPKPKNVPKGSLWAGSSDEEVMSAVLTVISPDPDEKEYTMSDLAHGIFYVDQSGAISGRAFRFRMDAFKVPFREDVKEGTTRRWRVYVKRDIRKTFGG